MASKKDFKVVKSFFAAWVERDGSVRFITENGEIATWKSEAVAKKALSEHWAKPAVFMVKGKYLK